jgi:hypothetical protein
MNFYLLQLQGYFIKSILLGIKKRIIICHDSFDLIPIKTGCRINILTIQKSTIEVNNIFPSAVVSISRAWKKGMYASMSQNNKIQMLVICRL